MPLRPEINAEYFRRRGDGFLPGLLGIEIVSLDIDDAANVAIAATSVPGAPVVAAAVAALAVCLALPLRVFLAGSDGYAERLAELHTHLLATTVVYFVAATLWFAEYERQIREEYAHVPGEQFRQRRRAILGSFLDRQRVYGTTHFHDRLEAAARANLRAAIDAC